MGKWMGERKYERNSRRGKRVGKKVEGEEKNRYEWGRMGMVIGKGRIGERDRKEGGRKGK